MRSGDMSKGKVLPRKRQLIHTFPRSTRFLSRELELQNQDLLEGPYVRKQYATLLGLRTT